MSDQFVGEIRLFAGTFAPLGWAFCDGQLLAIAQNDALFSLFGTTYGGDGRTTFGLPDLRGRVPIHQGSGPGLTPRAMGSKAGAEAVVLTASQMGGHTHKWEATSAAAAERTPVNNAMAETSAADIYSQSDPPQSPATMSPAMVGDAGGGRPHQNVQPYQCINYIVSLYGVYPSRN